MATTRSKNVETITTTMSSKNVETKKNKAKNKLSK